MKPMDRYRARATGNVQRVGMNYLSDLILRPGIEKTFGPLLLYRGAMNRGHAHRLWNATLMMMAAEAETLADGVKVLNNPDYSQLCGPVRTPTFPTLRSYFGRLHDNPAVTRNIEGLTDYVKFMGFDNRLTRVDRFSDQPECAPWRISLHPDAADHVPRERGIPESKQLFYPYIAHDPVEPDDGAALAKLVGDMVPTYLPDHIRADACQDLVVALLTGEIGPDQVEDRAKKFVNNVFKENNWKFGDKSLDARIPGTDGHFTLLDTLAG